MQTEIDALKAKLPLWLRAHHLPENKVFTCLNPAHADRHPSMRYDRRHQIVHCFACGASYDLFDLIGQEHGLVSFPEKLEAARRLYGSPVTTQPVRVRAVRRAGEALSSYRMGEGTPNPYFAARGLSDALVRRYGLRVDGPWAVLPVFSADGRCLSLCRRALDPQQEPRYKNSRGAMGLWNAAALARAAGKAVFVTEGIFDALSLEELGFPAVALCGAANARRLLDAVAALAQEKRPACFVLAGDGDAAGQRMNAALQQLLAPRPCRVLMLPQGCKDANEALVRDKDALQAACEAALPPAGAGLAEEFARYVEQRRMRSLFSTGLAGLDAALGGGLCPELLVLGAVSGMGKTTLMLQIADAVAAQGGRALFVSLEMSRFELLAKSFVRGGAHTAAELLNGQLDPQELRTLVSAYSTRTGGRVELWEPDGPLTPTLLARKMERCCQQGPAPVLFVDYLQLIASEQTGASDKQAADRAVAQLKQLARRWQVPVVAASSLNREAYRPGSTGPGLSAFKESGLVEYSADVLLALQYRDTAGMVPNFVQETAKPVRQVELVVLKNRFGRAGDRIALEYRPDKEQLCEGKPRPEHKKNVLR